jgi:hypothetical protein
MICIYVYVNINRVCTCIHQMLYLQPLSTMAGTAAEAQRRGFSGSSNGEIIRVPMCSLKRYSLVQLCIYLYKLYVLNFNLEESE